MPLRPVNHVIYSPEAINDLHRANSYWGNVNVLMLEAANRMGVIDKYDDHNIISKNTESYDSNLFDSDCKDIFMFSHHCVHDIINSM